MESPQSEISLTQEFEDYLKPPRLYVAVTLLLVGAASFYVAVSYFDGFRAPAAPQAAAASSTIDAFAGITIRARAAIVYDLATGKTLYERNADTQLPLASITKVMLALVVAENMPLDRVITIPFDTAPQFSRERLGKGEQWEVGDVINFTLVTSSNKGADILAAAVERAIQEHFPGAPAQGATIWRMNALASELGMTQTHFSNVSGLDLSSSESGAYASARDVARLFSFAASTSPHVLTATAENGFLLAGIRGDTTSASNTNEALGDIPGLIMGKTGYTELAGGNLAVVYDIGLAHPVVAVVMGSTQSGRFEDMRTLVPASRAAIMQ